MDNAKELTRLADQEYSRGSWGAARVYYLEAIEALKRQLAKALMDAAALRAEIDQYEDARTATNEPGQARAKCVCEPVEYIARMHAVCSSPSYFRGRCTCGHPKACHTDQQAGGQEKL